MRGNERRKQGEEEGGKQAEPGGQTPMLSSSWPGSRNRKKIKIWTFLSDYRLVNCLQGLHQHQYSDKPEKSLNSGFQIAALHTLLKQQN